MAGAGEAFIGIDVAKLRNAVAIADAGRDGEVRFYGEVDASPDSMRRLAARLAAKYDRLHFCPENKGGGRRRPRVKRRVA
jgi:transposase